MTRLRLRMFLADGAHKPPLTYKLHTCIIYLYKISLECIEINIEIICQLKGLTD
jgi:hypothetical protein